MAPAQFSLRGIGVRSVAAWNRRVHSPALSLLAVLVIFSGFIAGYSAEQVVPLPFAILAVIGMLAAETLDFIPGPNPKTAPNAIYISFVYSLLYALVGWLTSATLNL